MLKRGGWCGHEGEEGVVEGSNNWQQKIDAIHGEQEEAGGLRKRWQEEGVLLVPPTEQSECGVALVGKGTLERPRHLAFVRRRG